MWIYDTCIQAVYSDFTVPGGEFIAALCENMKEALKPFTIVESDHWKKQQTHMSVAFMFNPLCPLSDTRNSEFHQIF